MVTTHNSFSLFAGLVPETTKNLILNGFGRFPCISPSPHRQIYEILTESLSIHYIRQTALPPSPARLTLCNARHMPIRVRGVSCHAAQQNEIKSPKQYPKTYRKTPLTPRGEGFSSKFLGSPGQTYKTKLLLGCARQLITRLCYL